MTETLERVLAMVHTGLQSRRRGSVGVGAQHVAQKVTLTLSTEEARLVADALQIYKQAKSDRIFHNHLDGDAALSTETGGFRANDQVKNYLKRTFSRAPVRANQLSGMPLRPEFAALGMVTESGADGKGSGGSGGGDDGKRAKTELGRLRSDSSYRIDEIGAIALVNDPHDASRAALVRAASMLHQWDFDAFDVAGACALPLAFVGLEVLGSRDLLGELKIDWATLGRFLSRVDEAYCSDVPYHNSTHATDVTGTMNYFLTTGGLERHLTPVQTFSVLLGVMIHDVGHIGLNTAFLKGTNHELAIRYNDHSPLENMHLATAFGLMLDSSKRCDVFEHLEPALRSEIRFNMIDLVLATDMADHNRLLAEFDGLFAGHRARVGDAAAAAAAAAGGAPALPSVGGGRGDEPVIDMTHTQTAMTALKIFVHCADISNPCKPWNIYAKWTERVVAEFRRQAAMEIENGLALQGTASYRSTLEESFVLSRMQLGFIDYIVKPLYTLAGEANVVDLSVPLAQLADNRARWEASAAADAAAAAAAAATTAAAAES